MLLHHTLCNVLLTKQLEPENVTFPKGYRVLIHFEKTTRIQNAVALKKLIFIILKKKSYLPIYSLFNKFHETLVLRYTIIQGQVN